MSTGNCEYCGRYYDGGIILEIYGESDRIYCSRKCIDDSGDRALQRAGAELRRLDQAEAERKARERAAKAKARHDKLVRKYEEILKEGRDESPALDCLKSWIIVNLVLIAVGSINKHLLGDVDLIMGILMILMVLNHLSFLFGLFECNKAKKEAKRNLKL